MSFWTDAFLGILSGPWIAWALQSTGIGSALKAVENLIVGIRGFGNPISIQSSDDLLCSYRNAAWTLCSWTISLSKMLITSQLELKRSKRPAWQSLAKRHTRKCFRPWVVLHSFGFDALVLTANDVLCPGSRPNVEWEVIFLPCFKLRPLFLLRVKQGDVLHRTPN